jgi:prepilin-type N-terminal cleavage/methylation domain-containing protein
VLSFGWSAKKWRKGEIMNRKKGFTLVELLVVIAIIALLMAILIPALGRSRAQARRVVCAGRIRQFMLAVMAYADTYKDTLPKGAMGAPMSAITRGRGWSQPNWLWDTDYAYIAKYLKDTRIMMCTDVPAYVKSGISSTGQRYNGNPYIPNWLTGSWTCRTYLLGYGYMAGHYAQFWDDPSTYTDPAGVHAEPWFSPSRVIDKGNIPLVIDVVSYDEGESLFVGHAGTGSKEIDNPPSISIQQQAPAGGGNVGTMDGAVQWRGIKDMKPHMVLWNFNSYNTTAGRKLLWYW